MTPFVRRDGDDYLLYYGAGDQESRKRICVARAKVSDPTRWERLGVALDIGAGDAFDCRWVVVPQVVKVAARWHLYYTANCGRGTGLQRFPGIGVAVSDDGLKFARVSDRPVLAPSGKEGDPDAMGIAGGSVVAVTNADGRTEYRFYYTGAPTIGQDIFLNQQKIVCLATSSDGIEWTKRGALFHRIAERDYENVGVAGPVVWRDDDGLWRMLYSTIGTRWGFYSICYAESDDGLLWRRGQAYGENLVLSPHGDGWEKQMVEYPAVIREGSGLRLFYCGNGYGTTGIGTALSATT
ncbi:MAG TPA: hypothetical protein VEJ63_21205 [Planctomycetota bacterium]|nr:hypothetical protein [Planctomycetota bacterium]